MAKLLGPERARTSTPIVSMKRIGESSEESGTDDCPQYELFSTDNISVGIYDHAIFACHSPTTACILQGSGLANEFTLVDLLKHIEYADNVMYLHRDTSLLPCSRNARASWNCIGKSSLLTTHTRSAAYSHDAMEGSASGFGSHIGENPNYDHDPAKLEGIFGGMKAMYVTYYLNRLQNLKTNVPVMVSLNPHHPPKEKFTYRKFYMAHPQFTTSTLEARKKLQTSYQGLNGIWYAGAWQGYGFHEDGCRSGMLVAAALTKKAVPWAEGSATGVVPPPDLTAITVAKNTKSITQRLRHFVGYTIPVYICKKIIGAFLNKAIKYGRLELRLHDGSVMKFGNGKRVKGIADDEPVVLKVFDPWFFVKVAVEYDLGLARYVLSCVIFHEPDREELQALHLHFIF